MLPGFDTRVLRIPALLGLAALGALAGASGKAARPVQAASAYDVSHFYVGGTYTQGKDRTLDGAMYVERWQPRRIRHRYPVVLFHGAGMTGTNWTGTADGRPGWAQRLVAKGFTVYIVDQPSRGRSSRSLASDGKFARFPVEIVQQRFTASERYKLWPQAVLHTQWPGAGADKGVAGNPAFDAFYASTTPYLADSAETQRLVQAAGVALLDRIGPAILLTHSQAGAFGWLIADKRPALVKAIVAVEPLGPAFVDPDGKTAARPWGLTDIPMTYRPAVSDPAKLETVAEQRGGQPNLLACIKQKEPARKLVNLDRIPILVATGEASFHAMYDHCTAGFLRQAGANVTFVRLKDIGLTGNGHMMMLEKNSDLIVDYLATWMSGG